MLKEILIPKYLLFLFCVNFVYAQYFNGIDKNNELNSIFLFNPGNRSFTNLDQLLSSNSKYEISIGDETLIQQICPENHLNLPISQSFSIIRPKNAADSILDSIDIKLPFTATSSEDILFKKKFCLVYNENNIGFSFDTINSTACMNNSYCAIDLSSISISTEKALYIPNYSDSITFYDVINGYNIVDVENEFSIKLKLTLPSITEKLISFPKGFHYRSLFDFNIMGSLNKKDYFPFKLFKSRTDIFLNGENLFSLQNAVNLDGVLIDSNNACISNGVYLSSISNDTSFLIGSRVYSGIIGSNLLNINGQVDAGYYLDMKKDENNGFFIKGNSKLNLFKFEKVEVGLEIQFINSLEYLRRQNTACSNNSDLSDLTSFISNKFKHFSGSADDYYMFMNFNTKQSQKINLIANKLFLNSNITGYILSPNPYNHIYKYYGYFVSEGNILGIDNAIIEWVVNDQITEWKCIGKFDEYELELNLISDSSWLEENSSVTIASVRKDFKKVVIRQKKDTRGLGKAWKKIKNAVSSIANSIQNTWNKIKETYEKYKFAIQILYNGAMCYLQNYSACVQLAITIMGEVKFSGSFGRFTKTIQIGINQFNCPIMKSTFYIRCRWWKICSIDSIIYPDKNCMDKVKQKYDEIENKNKLAAWTQNELENNMKSNLGVQYAINQINAKKELFDEKDISVGDIEYEFPSVLRVIETFSKAFDSSDLTFFNEFNNDINNIFKPFDDNNLIMNPNKAYLNMQNMTIRSFVSINTTRLSAEYQGMDNVTINLNLPIYINCESVLSINQSIDNFFSDITKEDGVLTKAIIGKNVGMTEQLIDVSEVSEPVISLKNPINPTIYCDDPEIDEYYGDDDQKLVEGLRKYLTPITIDQMYRSCRSDIKYHDEVECSEHESICSATKCRFSRFIFDGCGQKSNIVFEDLVVLPRRPYFVEFPNSFALSCDETKNITQNEDRFIVPKVNPGCARQDYNLDYSDSTLEGKCSESLYRKWTTEIVGCEKSLFATKNQLVRIEDKKAPIFSYFPSDKSVEYFEFYGTDHTDIPRVYDSCGHGPSKLDYADSVKNLDNNEKLVTRTWTARDKCGNVREQIQKIRVKNQSKNDLNSNFKNFMLVSFNQTQLINSLVNGPLASRDKIVLVNSTIGNDEEFEDKCIKRQKWSVISGKKVTIEDSLIYGSIKSQSDFDFDLAYSQAVQLSKYLNSSTQELTVGAREILCYENSLNLDQEFPVSNYLNSSCSISNYKYHPINTIDESKLDYNKQTIIDLNSDELLYNLFYFKNPKLFENKIMRFKVPSTSIVVINFDNKDTSFNMNTIRVDFGSSSNSQKVIYNFLNEGDIIYDESKSDTKISGTILAPYSNFIKISDKTKSSSFDFINGQVFAKNIYISGVHQTCTLFEPFQN